MKKTLEGIVNILGMNVVLESVVNLKLKRILHQRLRQTEFNFLGGYSETHGDRQHTDRHNDRYTDGHRDSHTDHTSPGTSSGSSGAGTYYDPNKPSVHTDSGYSESWNQGYSEHTDFY